MNTHHFQNPNETSGIAGNVIPFPRRAKLPGIEFGTGWYHDAAIAEERQAKPQTRADWRGPPHGRT